MTKGRDIAAERLADIVELIRARKQSGLLSIEFFENGRLEEGEIYFQQGKPSFARTHNKTGTDALAALMNWRRVYFRFIADVPSPDAPRSSTFPTTGPLTGSSHISSLPATPIPSVHTEPLQNQWPQTRQIPSWSSAEVPALVEHSPQWIPGESSNTPHGEEPLGIGRMESLVPQKRGEAQSVLSLPLTRPQRSIYLLIDGRRTVADLSRCIGKSTLEVGRLLRELQDYDLIAV
jgi:hypothetical protein